MKTIKRFVIAAAGAAGLVLPMGLGAVAQAQTAPLQYDGPSLSCSGIDGEFPFTTSAGCDLAVDKLVSVNGGAFVEADTSAEAAQATVGDTITWKIILTSNSDEGLTPTGSVYVSDVLPAAGVSYVSSLATAGNYMTTGFFANNWSLPLLNGDGGSNLPATLTINTTSIATGLYQNTATLAKFDNGHCDGGCIYYDANPDNDSNDAWIDPSAKPVVLADTTTLTNTGSGTLASIIAGGLLAATGVSLVLARRNRKAYEIVRNR